jgi:hypothetical protein
MFVLKVILIDLVTHIGLMCNYYLFLHVDQNDPYVWNINMLYKLNKNMIYEHVHHVLELMCIFVIEMHNKKVTDHTCND